MRRTLIVAGSALLVATTLSGSARAAEVDRAPIAYLTGDNTQLHRPIALALGKDGTRYVADLDGFVEVFDATATGDDAPRQVIGNTDGGTNNSALDVALGVGRDPDGNIYVANMGSTGPSVVVFASDATGDATPLRVIKGAATGLHGPTGIAFDKAGRLYVSSRDNDSIEVFAPGATGNAIPLRTIAGAATGLKEPVGIAIDRAGVLHVANYIDAGAGSVTSYPATAVGNVQPLRTLSGSATTIQHPWALAVDDQDNLYVGDDATFGSIGSVDVFGPDADGNVAPTVRLTGPNTDIIQSGGVAVQKDHRVLVGRQVSGTMILTFKALVPIKPGAPRHLGVGGKASAGQRMVTWKAPASDGDAAITAYVVTVTHGSKIALKKKLPGSARSLTLKGAALVKGTNQVSVQALNKVGAGPVAKRSFTVAR